MRGLKLPLQGKGIFISEILACESGNPQAIVKRAAAAGFNFVALKIAEGIEIRNDKRIKGSLELANSLVSSLHNQQIAVWGWHRPQLRQPDEEAKLVANRVSELDLDGYIEEPQIQLFPSTNNMMVQSSFQPVSLEDAQYFFKTLQGELSGFPGAFMSDDILLISGDLDRIGHFQFLITQTDPQDMARLGAGRLKPSQLIPLVRLSSSSEGSKDTGAILGLMDNARGVDLAGVAIQDWDIAGRTENEALWDAIAKFEWAGFEGERPDAPGETAQEVTTTDEPPQEAQPQERRQFYNFMLNDQPEGEDRLNYERYAQALAAILSSADTHPPLTVGIYGSWGMGKTFLMNKIKDHLERANGEKDGRIAGTDPPGASPGVEALKVDIHTIRFNAWVYSGSENLWAGMITNLYSEVEKYFGRRRTAFFRLGESFRRSVWKTLGLIAVYGLLALAFSLLLNFADISERWRNFQAALGNFWKPVVSGGALAAIIGSALAALAPLVKTIQDLLSSLVLARSEQLKALSSQPDFKDKVGFMADIKREIGLIARLLNKGKHGRPTRLVIFIDDLDRCPPSKAVEVLEAIMLLLADQEGSPFIVVLGLDARILVKAVEARYGEVLTKAGITGFEYLDKIVQIPFRIPAPAQPEIQTYVDSLLWRSEQERKDWERQQAQEEREKRAAEAAGGAQPTPRQGISEPGEGQPTADDGHGPGELDQAPPVTGEGGRATDSKQPETGQREPTVPQPAPEIKVVEVAFIEEERKALDDFAPYMSPNPRTIKRIVNIYRMVRLLLPEDTKAQPDKFIKWVILTEQWPYRITWMMQKIEDDDQTGGEFSNQKMGTMKQVYDSLKEQIERQGGENLASLDADPELFDLFIQAEPPIYVEDVRRLRPYTFNLNPAMQGEVIKAAARVVYNDSSK